MQVPIYVLLKPLFYMVAIVIFWQVVRRKADSQWRFAFIMAVLFVLSVGLSIYETTHGVDAVIVIAGNHFSYVVVKSLLENVGLFAIVSLLLLLLNRRLHSARRELRLLAGVAASSADAIVTVNPAGRITSWNLGAELVFGYHAEEIVDCAVSRLVEADGEAKFAEVFQRCISDGFVKGLSCPMLAKGRKQILCEVTVSLICDESGVPAGMSLFVRDVTEQKKIQAELIQSSKMSAMGTMAAGIVHEFGNLLTVISGRAQLGKTAKTIEEARVAFDAVAACAARAKSVTNNLLAYAKRQQPNKSTGQFSAAADAAVGLLEKELQRANIVVNRHYQPVPDTDFDREQMTQVFINLIINAINAMRDAGGSIDISISRRNSYIEAEIRDTGPGIPPEVMSNLFEPFSTMGGQADGKPRTGLGLFVCREIVKFHSGNICVDSGKDKGTAFRVYLPVASAAGAPGPSDAIMVEHGSCRVAVIDRDVMIRDLLAEAFRRKGMEVDTFQDAASAEAKGVSVAFDLLFVDTSLKRADGSKYIDFVKNAGHPFVVAMVGEALDSDEFRKVEKNTLSTLRKPFGLDQVNAICDSVVSPPGGPASDHPRDRSQAA